MLKLSCIVIALDSNTISDVTLWISTGTSPQVRFLTQKVGAAQPSLTQQSMMAAVNANSSKSVIL